MTKWHWSLLVLYFAVAAGYGGWRGPDLWSDSGVWFLLLPPLALAAGKAVVEYRRNPYGTFVVANLVWTLLAVVGIGGPALLLAWLVAAVTPKWSAEPAMRAAIGVALAQGGVGMAVLAAKSR
jgi:hypothetical protein